MVSGDCTFRSAQIKIILKFIFLINVIFSLWLSNSAAYATELSSFQQNSCNSAFNQIGKKIKEKASAWYERTIRRENYYPVKKAYNILYPKTGNSPLDEPIGSFFPNLYDEIDHDVENAKSLNTDEKQGDNEISLYHRMSNKDLEALYLTDAEFNPFREQAFHLLFLRRNLGGDGRTGGSQFKDWAVGVIESYREKSRMKELLAQPHTWRTFFDVELKRKFDSSGYMTLSKYEQFLYKRYDHPAALIPAVATYKTFKWTLAILGAATVAGIVPVYVNHATAQPQNILIQKVDQWSTIHERWLTNLMQDKMIDASTIATEKAKVLELEDGLKKIRLKDLKGKTPDEAEKSLESQLDPLKKTAREAAQIITDDPKRLKDMLKVAIDFSTQETGYLPGNQAGARGFVWGAQIFFPLDMADRVSLFDTNQTTHETMVEIMTEKLETLQSLPVKSASTKARISQLQTRIAAQQRAMEVAAQQAATALAIWKVNEFMFPDLTKQWLNEKEETSLTRTYRFFKEKFLFNYYLEAYGKQADITVNNLHQIIAQREAYLKNHH